MVDRVRKSGAEWRSELSSEKYAVTRQKGTEPAFTGKYWDHTAAGVYRCSCCGMPLFASETNFDAGCGWPSFTEPIAAGNVATQEDRSHFMRRTELLCAACEAHLGHVFDDGPGANGLRYCMNSASLDFEPQK